MFQIHIVPVLLQSWKGFRDQDFIARHATALSAFYALSADRGTKYMHVHTHILNHTYTYIYTQIHIHIPIYIDVYIPIPT